MFLCVVTLVERGVWTMAVSPKTKRAAGNMALDIRIASMNGEKIWKYLFGVLDDDMEASTVRIQAAQILLNRGFGREQIEVNVTNEDESELRKFGLEELVRIEKALLAIPAESVVVGVDDE